MFFSFSGIIALSLLSFTTSARANPIRSVPHDLSRASFDEFQVGDKLTVPAGFSFEDGRSQYKSKIIFRDGNAACSAEVGPFGDQKERVIFEEPQQFAVTKIDYKGAKFLELESVKPVGENQQKLKLRLFCSSHELATNHPILGSVAIKSYGLTSAASFFTNSGFVFQSKDQKEDKQAEGSGGGDADSAILTTPAF